LLRQCSDNVPRLEQVQEKKRISPLRGSRWHRDPLRSKWQILGNRQQ